ncbi:MAG: Fe-S cluster assembly ATPase SufC [Myxococcota bacterium]
MLEIKDLHARIEEREILKGLNLTVRPGEVHAIMGPNAAGKSTLAKVLCGHDDYEVTGGQALLDGNDLLEMDPEERAREGVFMSFQHPVEIPGVTNAYFMRSAINAHRKHRGEPEIEAGDFLKLAKEKMELVEMPSTLLNRSINEGFSGGEKKRNEIFQMAMLDPRLAVLDETDSGLDIDALRTVAEGVNKLRNGERMLIVITHYQRLLDYLVPDFTMRPSRSTCVWSGTR